MVRAVVVLLACYTSLCFADLPALCFDFSRTVKSPLRKPMDLPKSGEAYSSGVEKSGLHWAAARGKVSWSFDSLLEWLLDHRNWKDMSRTKMKTTNLTNPHFYALHKVDVDVRVWGFISLKWTEQWAYALLAGTKTKPEAILASYQKTAGTSHIKHLCGSVQIQKITPDVSDIYFYEEAVADRYEASHILKMHEDRFVTFKKKKSK